MLQRRITGCLAACALLIGSWNVCVWAHEHEDGEHAHVEEFTDAKQHAPSPLPDRVVLTWADDPRTTMCVTWRTKLGTGAPRAEIAPANTLVGSLLTGDVPGAKVVEGQKADFTSDLATVHINTVQLTGLQPATMYAYRVGDGEHWSEWFQFNTAADSDEPFTFVYFGDAQNAVRAMWSRVIREANQHAPRAAFMLHAGDLVNRGQSDAEWGEWFGAGGWLNGMIPVVATPGNHEYVEPGGDPNTSRLTTHWAPQFQFPANGPSGLEESVYWFDYQGARIVSLNSNERVEEQIAWLDAVLRDDERPKWTIVTFHHPIFSAAKERDNPSLRTAWKPLFDKHGVDLVLQGHDHAYARSPLGGPADNVADGVRRSDSNTVYVVSVSGPKMYPLQQRWQIARTASGVQLFQVIHVSPEAIKYEARLATGELYDAFRLTKGENGKSQLEDQIPDRPEIRE